MDGWSPTRSRRDDLPGAEAQTCIDLARTLDLPVAGIDLRRTPSGEWYCFEVNPSPAYSWFDLDGRIATTIACFLASR
jgi:D-alanine-D-alanine ligase-like ATP-grasp enzyme